MSTSSELGADRDLIDRYRPMSLGTQLARTAAKRPEHVAFKYEADVRTFAQLDDRVTRLANHLRSRGVGRGDRVAVLMTNRIEVVETYLAGCRIGALVVPINFRLVPDEIRYVIADSGARAIVFDSGLGETAANVRSCVEMGLHWIQVDADGDAPSDSWATAYEAAIADASPRPLDVIVGDHDPAFIMYTSGTTGRPKGAVLSHFNLTMNTHNMMLENQLGSAGDEVWLSGLPLFHIGGLNGILPYLMIGGTSIILPTGSFDAGQVLELLERERITGCYFVPTQWQQVCAHPDLATRELHLRRISWGASVAPPSVLQAMAESFPGVPTLNAFGQTEMSSVTCVLRGEDAIRKMGSVGMPVPNVEARIVDDEMRDVAPGQVGEIVYRGPTVMQGYWQNPEATDEAFAGGWFHSGDLCRRDEDGFIYVVDRKKDMIISGGENIYSAEVEAAIDQHPGVAEVAVIGVPHERWVETPVAIITASDPSAPPTEEEIIDFCRTKLASYKKPSRVVVVDELPRNASGKVLKRTLREQLV